MSTLPAPTVTASGEEGAPGSPGAAEGTPAAAAASSSSAAAAAASSSAAPASPAPAAAAPRGSKRGAAAVAAAAGDRDSDEGAAAPSSKKARAAPLSKQEKAAKALKEAWESYLSSKLFRLTTVPSQVTIVILQAVKDNFLSILVEVPEQFEIAFLAEQFNIKPAALEKIRDGKATPTEAEKKKVKKVLADFIVAKVGTLVQ